MISFRDLAQRAYADVADEDHLSDRLDSSPDVHLPDEPLTISEEHGGEKKFTL
jgi:hypothetical protein